GTIVRRQARAGLSPGMPSCWSTAWVSREGEAPAEPERKKLGGSLALPATRQAGGGGQGGEDLVQRRPPLIITPRPAERQRAPGPAARCLANRLDAPARTAYRRAARNAWLQVAQRAWKE